MASSLKKKRAHVREALIAQADRIYALGLELRRRGVHDAADDLGRVFDGLASIVLEDLADAA